MSHRFARSIAIAGAVALAGLAACSDSTTQPKADNATLAGTDSAASDNFLTDLFGMMGNTVSVSMDSSSIAVGHAAHAVATVKDRNGKAVSNATVTWSSSNAKMASVASNGTVTGVAAGSATITATYQGKSGKSTVNVTAAPSAPSAAPSTIQVTTAASALTVGKTTQASYKLLDASGKSMSGPAVVWGSNNTAIATVSAKGVVTAVAPGLAYVVAYVGTTYGYATVNVSGTAATAPTQPSQPSQPTQPTQPTQPSQPAQPSQPTGTGNLASANFEDGSYGSLIAETPAHLSIVADPTNSGHGKVMQVAFTGSGASADLNQFASWDPSSGLSHGATVYFRGQVYFPANTTHFNDALRKLIYFRTNLGTSGQQCDYVINMFGTDVGLEVSAPSIGDVRWGNLFQMPLGQWVTLEVQITMNSKPGVKDGSTAVWINGNQVLSKTGIAFTQASDPTTTRWSWLAVGTQREGTAGDGAINEVRYWDNLAWGTSRIGN